MNKFTALTVVLLAGCVSQDSPVDTNDGATNRAVAAPPGSAIHQVAAVGKDSIEIIFRYKFKRPSDSRDTLFRTTVDHLRPTTRRWGDPVSWQWILPDPVVDTVVSPPPVDTSSTDTVVVPPPVDTVVPPPVDTAVSIDTTYRIPGPISFMPREWLYTEFHRNFGDTIRVPNGGNLQAAINSAPRPSIILLPENAVYIGNFSLPEKSGNDTITIQTETTLPPPGHRVFPNTATKFAKIITPNALPAVWQTARSHHYRLVGLEITSSATMTYMIVQAGPSVGRTDSLAGNFVIDRSYVHGGPTVTSQRCIALAGERQAVINSYISECHYKGQDAQAVFGYAGPGPYQLVNNFFEGSGENVMFGGADPKIAGLIPSDIEIRRNHFYKPPDWRINDSVSKWTVKNLFELKNAKRVLVEENIFENTWADGQNVAITFKSVNQGGKCPQCQVADVTYRWNQVINAPVALNITPVQSVTIGTTKYYGKNAERIHIYQSAFDSVDQNTQWKHQWAFLIGHSITGMVIERTTSDPQRAILYMSGTKADSNKFLLNFIQNVTSQGTGGLGILGDSYGGVGAMTYYCPTCQFTGNVIKGGTASKYPSGNTMVSTTTTTDTSVGVNRTELMARLRGVREGTPKQ